MLPLCKGHERPGVEGGRFTEDPGVTRSSFSVLGRMSSDAWTSFTFKASPLY